MASTNQLIIPMVWFDNQAEEAARFYTSVFPNSQSGRITRYVKEGQEIHGREEGSVMTIDFELEGQRFSFLNGGPIFMINPSISFFATFRSESETDTIWNALLEGGMALMVYGPYPWSPKYGWVQDKFGISWQIAWAGEDESGNQSILTSLLFVGEHCGQAESAMDFYTSIFKNSKVEEVLHYGANEAPEKEGTVKYAQFSLNGQTFMAMDSALQHNFAFNEAVSLMVYCENQEEIDYYWDKLSEGGDPKAQVCGWLKDKFGVSWQVVPSIMDDMLQDGNTEKVERVTKAFMKMKKFDVEELKRAFNGEQVI